MKNKQKKQWSESERKEFAEKMKRLREAKKKAKEDIMGLFGKKKVETKTFVEGQQVQTQTQQAQPIPGLQMPAPVVPNNTEQELLRLQIQQAQLEAQARQQAQRQMAQEVALQPGFLYWVDEYGDICMKPRRRG